MAGFNGTYSKFGGKTTWNELKNDLKLTDIEQKHEPRVNTIQWFQQYEFAYVEHFQKT